MQSRVEGMDDGMYQLLIVGYILVTNSNKRLILITNLPDK
jgi:hypothetical protein